MRHIVVKFVPNCWAATTTEYCVAVCSELEEITPTLSPMCLLDFWSGANVHNRTTGGFSTMTMCSPTHFSPRGLFWRRWWKQEVVLFKFYGQIPELLSSTSYVNICETENFSGMYKIQLINSDRIHINKLEENS